jgi:hypothetical protein
MRLYEDTYLKSLTEIEKFGGLRESTTSTNAYHALITLAIQKHIEPYPSLILYIKKQEDKTHTIESACFFNNEKSSVPFTNYKAELTNMTIWDESAFGGPDVRGPAKNGMFAVLYLNPKFIKVKEFLIKSGFKQGRETTGDEAWKTVEMQMTKKYGKGWESEVLNRVGDILGSDVEVSWSGTGK